MSKLIDVTAILLTVAYFSFALLILTLRLAILPQIESYRPEIEALLSKAIQREVKIRQIEAFWVGLQPALTLHGLEIKDDKGRAALTLDTVEAELAWDSLASMRIRLARFEIVSPSLVVRRSAADNISIAGMNVDPLSDGYVGDPNADPLAKCASDSAAAIKSADETPCDKIVTEHQEQDDAVRQNDQAIDWLLAQHRVVIRNANIVWIDELRHAPPLELKQLNFSLEKVRGRHRFGFNAKPPLALASRIDFRADFRGNSLGTLRKWQGESYVELDYADLAAWQKWIDYPVDLPRGQGALRLWLGVERGQIESLTADVRIDDLRIRLRKDLPELDLAKLEGRISGRRTENEFSFSLKNLSLSTNDGLSVSPTNINFLWAEAQPNKPARGLLTANAIDLNVFAQLSKHLPVNASIHSQITAYSPAGQLHDLGLEWAGDLADFQHWKITSRFEKLRLKAYGSLPGIAGLSGSITGSEINGKLSLNAQQAQLDFPHLFDDSQINLTAFSAQSSWRAISGKPGHYDISVDKLSFTNQDFTGDGSGHWQTTIDGTLPTAMDLSLNLKTAKVDSVWRYLPRTVSNETRTWIKQSLRGGTLTGVKLLLKGNLVDYPFRGGKGGTFVVSGNFADTNLDYADYWPPIAGLSGEILFASETMRIRANSGSVFGASLKDVTAELPDLEANEQILTVKGRAAGPTADFMHFIDTSPVKKSIDNAIEDMQATGSGELDLKLVIPLSTEAPAQVDGTFRFLANQVVIGKGIPPLTDLNGRIKFTANSVESKGLRANWLGSPMSAEIKAGSDGTVNVTGGGEISVAGLRNEYPMPLLDHLAGVAKWTGNIRVKKKVPEILISSSLVGLSSSLPVPFNKTESESMPLHFERRAPQPPEAKPVRSRGARAAVPVQASTVDPNLYDTIDLSLGKIAQSKVQRRGDKTATEIVRGYLLVNAASVPVELARLPDRGFQIAVDVPRVDLDFWRPLMTFSTQTHKTPDDSAHSTGVPVQFKIRADELRVFGKRFGHLNLNGNHTDNIARFTLKTTEVSGDFEWDSRGNGKLTGKIPMFSIPEAAVALPNVKPTSASDFAGDDRTSQIPAFDITVGKLMHKERELGSLDLQAENVSGEWRGKFDIHNDDAILKGNALWRPLSAQPNALLALGGEPVYTSVDFSVDAKNMENLLVRFGYGDTMRRGTAKIDGKLSWQGSPLAFDYPSLGGKFNVNLDDGQFKQLEPGVGGRLLGVLSLSSLPRRITLDFRDIFSQGFAFDSIEGDVVVTRGVMDTHNMEIKGPAARVLFNGSVNLTNETQDLKVSVQPAVGETIAVGAMLINPVAGAALWLSQKLFKDPVGKALSYDYIVSGSWSDPKVVQLGKSVKESDNAKAMP